MVAAEDTLLRFLTMAADLDGGECRPTQRMIAAATGLTVPEVRAATAALVLEGVIQVDRPGADSAPTPNRYRLTGSPR